MEKYTHEQATDASKRFTSLYGCQTTVADSDFPVDSELTNYSFVGVHLDGHCVCSFSSEEQFAALRKMAHLITQTDQDLRQEIERSSKEQDFIERTLAANNLT